MPANEPLMGLPYPLSSDGDDVPRDIKALADAVALKMARVPQAFGTIAERDAFYTANPGLKVAGIVAVIGTGASYAEYTWNGATWVRQAGYLRAALGTAGQSITGSGANLTPTLDINELGASVAGSALTGIPPGRYLLRALIRVSLSGPTWVAAAAFGASGVSTITDSGAEINAGSGYNALEIVTPVEVTSTGGTLGIDITPNATITLRQPASLVLIRL